MTAFYSLTLILAATLLICAPAGTVGGLVVTGALVLAFSGKMRRQMVAVLKAMVVMALFVILIAAAGLVGGGTLNETVETYLPRLDFVFAALFFSALASALFTSRDILRLLDTVRCPRYVTYLLLSVVTVQRYVRTLGNDQLAMLKLKGLLTAHSGDQLRAYYRILAPMLAQLIERQVTHARSMQQRGFFDSSARNNCRTWRKVTAR